MSARRNNSTLASVDNDEYARGGFKVVYMGTYTRGARKGQECVSKLFASGSVYEDSYFQNELNIIDAAMKIIENYNEGGYIDRHIRLNEPEIWTFISGNKKGQKNLTEPFIENFQKFNSNTGWQDRDGTPWNLVMQSLSHFSYHNSGGRLVLCDLQGGIYSDGAVLTDPVVMSADRRYGVTDLGREGIITFFARHRCNKYCRAEWSKPKQPVVHFPEQEGSYMMAVPTRKSRAPLSHFY